jgi:hypothetical protein
MGLTAPRGIIRTTIRAAVGNGAVEMGPLVVSISTYNTTSAVSRSATGLNRPSFRRTFSSVDLTFVAFTTAFGRLTGAKLHPVDRNSRLSGAPSFTTTHTRVVGVVEEAAGWRRKRKITARERTIDVELLRPM